MPDRTCCEGCCVRHECEPNIYPAERDDRWTCPECGQTHYAFDVREFYAGHPDPTWQTRGERIPAGTLGWTTRKPAAKEPTP